MLLACVEPQTGRLRGILALLLLAYAISLHACLYRRLISSAGCPPNAFSCLAGIPCLHWCQLFLFKSPFAHRLSLSICLCVT